MTAFAKKTKTKLYINFNNEIFKTSNNKGDGWEKVDFSKLQSGQIDAIESPHNWVELGEFPDIQSAHESFLGLQKIDHELRKAHNEDFLQKQNIIIAKEWASISGLEVIPTTVENIKIVARHLNSLNWGEWKLPKMEISYSANQYDCDGKQATTIKLDTAISDQDYNIENEFMFVFGAPRGHLAKYRRI